MSLSLAKQPDAASIPDRVATRRQGIRSSIQLSDLLAVAVLLLFVVVFSTLTIRAHQSFNTAALDLAKFDQSIWNTSRGDPYAITLSEDTVNDSHFSPALAIFAPLYWIWADIRLLLIALSCWAALVSSSTGTSGAQLPGWGWRSSPPT